MTFKVICRNDVICKNNTSPLCLLFFHNGRKKSVGLSISIAREYWDSAAQKVTDDCPNRDEIQFQVTAKVKEYEKKIHKLEVMEIPVTFETLFETVGKRIDCTVGEYVKQIIAQLEILGKFGSASKHRSLLSRLAQFRSVNIRFDEIDFTYLRDFEIFLRREGNANNSIATKFAIFKAAYNKALAEGVFFSKRKPFTQYKVGSLWTKTRKWAVTKEGSSSGVSLSSGQWSDFFFHGIEFAPLQSARCKNNRAAALADNLENQGILFALFFSAVEHGFDAVFGYISLICRSFSHNLLFWGVNN